MLENNVSIHAPARGATGAEQVVGIFEKVSIHAPARGATIDGNEIRWDGQKVSIHAPARGATGVQAHAEPKAAGFNPRPCARGDRFEGKD